MKYPGMIALPALAPNVIGNILVSWYQKGPHDLERLASALDQEDRFLGTVPFVVRHIFEHLDGDEASGLTLADAARYGALMALAAVNDQMMTGLLEQALNRRKISCRQREVQKPQKKDTDHE